MEEFFDSIAPISTKWTMYLIRINPSPKREGRNKSDGPNDSTQVSRMYETAWCDEDSMPEEAAIWPTIQIKDGFVSARQAPSRDKEYL